jgi:hypothetical protein
MRDTDAALAVHAREEFGIDPDDLPLPHQAAALSFVCFIVGALLPVIPWFTGQVAPRPAVARHRDFSRGGARLGGRAVRRAQSGAQCAAQVLIMLVACVVHVRDRSVLDVSVS